MPQTPQDKIGINSGGFKARVQSFEVFVEYESVGIIVEERTNENVEDKMIVEGKMHRLFSRRRRGRVMRFK